jgi:hypothetical protein
MFTRVPSQVYLNNALASDLAPRKPRRNKINSSAGLLTLAPSD